MQSKTEEGNNNQGGAMSSVTVVKEGSNQLVESRNQVGEGSNQVREGSNQVGEGKNKVVEDSVRKGENSNSSIAEGNSTAGSSKGGEKTSSRFRLQRLLGKVCK